MGWLKLSFQAFSHHFPICTFHCSHTDLLALPKRASNSFILRALHPFYVQHTWTISIKTWSVHLRLQVSPQLQITSPWTEREGTCSISLQRPFPYTVLPLLQVICSQDFPEWIIPWSVKMSSPARLHDSSLPAQCLTYSRHSVVVTGEFSALLLYCASRV